MQKVDDRDIMRIISGLGGNYIAEEIIKRSKDKNIIYMTTDIILDTNCVKELANYIEQLEKEIDNLIEENHKHIDYIADMKKKHEDKKKADMNKLINYIAIRENKTHEDICKEFELGE